jgi:hypothetical protein
MEANAAATERVDYNEMTRRVNCFSFSFLLVGPSEAGDLYHYIWFPVEIVL